MPCKGYGLEALATCATGSRAALNPRAICHFCYATRGNYRFAEVKAAHAARKRSLTDNPSWVADMATLINFFATRERGRQYHHFRWHDSGDLLGLWHLELIVAVCRLTPRVRHWLPTHEYATVRRFLDQGGVLPPNLVVRASAMLVDGPAPRVTDSSRVLPLLPTSTVRTDAVDRVAGSHTCPAPLQANSCGDCRACWSPAVANVSYHVH